MAASMFQGMSSQSLSIEKSFEVDLYWMLTTLEPSRKVNARQERSRVQPLNTRLAERTPAFLAVSGWIFRLSR